MESPHESHLMFHGIRVTKIFQIRPPLKKIRFASPPDPLFWAASRKNFIYYLGSEVEFDWYPTKFAWYPTRFARYPAKFAFGIRSNSHGIQPNLLGIQPDLLGFQNKK